MTVLQFPGVPAPSPCESVPIKDSDRGGRRYGPNRTREAVQMDIAEHVRAREAYTEAIVRQIAVHDAGLPDAKYKEAGDRIFQTAQEMRRAARRLLICMPTDPRALIDLLMYLEQNFTTLPPEIDDESLAYSLLRTVRLSLRQIVRDSKRKATP